MLELKDIKKFFPVKKGLLRKEVAKVKAVDGVSLAIKEREVLGLVGESGCGKSTLGRIIVKLIFPDCGNIFLKGKNITNLNHKQMLPLRSSLQIVFQDPYSSLDPLFSVYEILREALNLKKGCKSKVRQIEQMDDILQKVGLPKDCLNRLPHQFSGGQRQRIAIARALIVNPEFLVLDEPISSLDVLIQIQILELLKELQENLSLSYLFISHNLRVIRKISNRVAVMYLGKIVELAPTIKLFELYLHPYTSALIKSSFFQATIKGEPTSNIESIMGCIFQTRCSHKKPQCTEQMPKLTEIEKGHFVACHFPLNQV